MRMDSQITGDIAAMAAKLVEKASEQFAAAGKLIEIEQIGGELTRQRASRELSHRARESFESKFHDCPPCGRMWPTPSSNCGPAASATPDHSTTSGPAGTPNKTEATAARPTPPNDIPGNAPRNSSVCHELGCSRESRRRFAGPIEMLAGGGHAGVAASFMARCDRLKNARAPAAQGQADTREVQQPHAGIFPRPLGAPLRPGVHTAAVTTVCR